MERPTNLKLYDFPENSFINGCYIRESICDEVIDFFEKNPDRHTSGKVYGRCAEHQDELVEDDLTKKSTDIYFDPSHIPDALFLNSYIFDLNKCISEYEFKYKRAHYLQSYGVLEPIQLQKYEPSEGFFAWHCEREGHAQQTRCFAFMTYLNTVPAGGTEFMYQNLTIPAIKGLTCIWPSDWTHTHRGQISKEHKKYVLTGWLNYSV